MLCTVPISSHINHVMSDGSSTATLNICFMFSGLAWVSPLCTSFELWFEKEECLVIFQLGFMARWTLWGPQLYSPKILVAIPWPGGGILCVVGKTFNLRLWYPGSIRFSQYWFSSLPIAALLSSKMLLFYQNRRDLPRSSSELNAG